METVLKKPRHPRMPASRLALPHVMADTSSTSSSLVSEISLMRVQQAASEARFNERLNRSSAETKEGLARCSAETREGLARCSAETREGLARCSAEINKGLARLSAEFREQQRQSDERFSEQMRASNERFSEQMKASDERFLERMEASDERFSERMKSSEVQFNLKLAAMEREAGVAKTHIAERFDAIDARLVKLDEKVDRLDAFRQKIGGLTVAIAAFSTVMAFVASVTIKLLGIGA